MLVGGIKLPNPTKNAYPPPEKPIVNTSSITVELIDANLVASEIKAKTSDSVLAQSILTTLILEQGDNNGKRVLRTFGNNCGGVQADGGRWGNYDSRLDGLISYTFDYPDSLSLRRFAGFKSRLDFVQFMVIRWGQIVKEMDVKDAATFNRAYKFKWWLGVNSDQQVIEELKKNYHAEAFTVLKQKDYSIDRIWKEAGQILHLAKASVSVSNIGQAIVERALSFVGVKVTQTGTGEDPRFDFQNGKGKAVELLKLMESKGLYNQTGPKGQKNYHYCDAFCRAIFVDVLERGGNKELAEAFKTGFGRNTKSDPFTVPPTSKFATSNKPVVGAVVYYESLKGNTWTPQHVGIVQSHTPDYSEIVTVEGNYPSGAQDPENPKTLYSAVTKDINHFKENGFTGPQNPNREFKVGEFTWRMKTFIYPPDVEGDFLTSVLSGITDAANNAFNPQNIIYIKDLFLNRINFSDTVKNVAAFIGDNFRA